MPITFVVTSNEYTEVDSPSLGQKIPLSTPGWRVEDNYMLLGGAKDRSTDDEIPGEHGADPNPQFLAEGVHDLTVFVMGKYDGVGAANTNPRTGVQKNLAYLQTHVVAPIDTGDGTRETKLHLTDTSTVITEDCKWSMQPDVVRRAPGLYVVTFTVVVPAGVFA